MDLSTLFSFLKFIFKIIIINFQKEIILSKGSLTITIISSTGTLYSGVTNNLLLNGFQVFLDKNFLAHQHPLNHCNVCRLALLFLAQLNEQGSKSTPPPRKRKSAARGNHAEHHPGRKPGAQLQRGRPRPRRRGEQRCLVYTVQCVQRWGHGVHRDVVLGHANEVSRAALCTLCGVHRVQ